ncbi:hypothetical protein [Phytoactinopolyspora mesophila]|uniref:Family 10 glycosylhydrolase n=1 Tax=Phytoactinopolyspora mesophila TaxID=2650750 RepID=A0A7K3M819_9ACTN|nr:hypothetical protein [Phytoactinopolyspora mesophila]NDL59471.1 hypothetical protein [Phytoactinopolyspora mesophila]
MTLNAELTDMRAVYLRPAGVQRWPVRERAERLDALAGAGIDTVVTKLRAAEGPFAAECRARGLRLVGSFGCFIDHALPAEIPPQLRPVDEHGRVFEPMRWYHGVIPTSTWYLEALTDELRAVLDNTEADGVVLDFIRWPCHWELELRPGATWRRSSFDPITLTRFNEHLASLGEPGIDPADPVRAAATVRDRLAATWEEFRCDVVADACRRLTDVVTASGRWAGAFIVPATDELRRAAVGQDTRKLGEIVDVLLPMTYHAALQRPASWLAIIGADIVATTVTPDGKPAGPPVVTMVQGPATEDHWGVSPGSPDFAHALSTAMTWQDHGSGFCVFPGDEFGPDELAAISEHRR